MVPQVEGGDSCLYQFALRTFAHDEITDVVTLGQQPRHDLSEKVHHSFAFDEPAHSQQHFAAPDDMSCGGLEVAHPL